MAKKNKETNRFADRFYQYLMERRDEILRYVTAALVTALLQYFLRRAATATDYGILVPFLIRFALMFLLLKYWVYKEKGTGAFYTGRQLMLALMAIPVITLAFNWLAIVVISFAGHAVFINYLFQALLEIAYFAAYQFFIYKEPKND